MKPRTMLRSAGAFLALTLSVTPAVLRAAGAPATPSSATTTKPKAASTATPKAAKPAASGTVNRSKAPALPPPPALHLPHVKTVELPNGLSIAVVEMHEVPVVDVTLMLAAGAARDPDDLPGLATFTSNMLDEGAGARSALEIADEAEFLGAALSTAAGPEMAQINLHALKRRLGPALDLMADVALRPTFPDSEVARQRDLRRTGLLQLRDQPTAMAPLAFNAIVFGPSHPYGRPTGGNEESTALLSRDRVKRFYDQFYRPSNAKILIVGDVTPDEAKELISARFGAWAGAEVAPRATATAAAARERTFYLVDKPGAAQSVIRIGHVGVARSTPDYFPLLVLNTILGGSFTSRLNQNLRETHGYTYGAGSAFEMRRLAGPFRASASVVTAKTDSSIIEFMRELRRIRDEAIPAAEIEKAKSYLALGMPSDFETTAGSAGQFADLLANDLPLDSYDHYIDRVRAVTPADLKRVAKTYIDPDHFAIVVVGDRGQIEKGIQALKEGPIVLRDLWGHEVP